MTGRPAPQSTGRRPAKLSRDAIVNAALTFLDRDGWDALTNTFRVVVTEKFLRTGNVWAPASEGMMAAGL